MRKFSLALFLLIGFMSSLFAQSDVSPSKWKPGEIVIDGVANEWYSPLNFYDDKTGLNYAICNDKDNLYFVFTTPDEIKMRKMMTAGWTIQLISKEKNKKFKASLSFPGVKMAWIGERRDVNPMEKKITENPLVSAYQSGTSTIYAKGFQTNQSELRLNNRNGINIAIGADSLQHIVYEMAIPLKELFVPNSITLNELITLNISVNAMERPSFNNGNNGGTSPSVAIAGMGGGRGGMGGGMGGGMSRGGMSRGGMSRSGISRDSSGDRSGMFEQASFKQKFKLVQN